MQVTKLKTMAIPLVLLAVSSSLIVLDLQREGTIRVGILYDETDYVSSMVAMDLRSVISPATIVMFGSLDRDLGKVDHLFVVAHGSEAGIKFGGRLVTWADISLLADSSGEKVYMISCFSDNFEVHSRLGSKLVFSISGIADAVVAELVSLAYFFDQVSNGYPELAENVRSYLRFVFVNYYGEIMDRASNPKNPMVVSPQPIKFPDIGDLLRRAIENVLKYFLTMPISLPLGVCTITFGKEISMDYEGIAWINGRYYYHFKIGVEGSMSLACPGIDLDLFDRSVDVADVYVGISDASEVIVSTAVHSSSMSTGVSLFGFSFNFKFSVTGKATAQGYTYNGKYYPLRKLVLDLSANLYSSGSHYVWWVKVAEVSLDIDGWYTITIDFLGVIKGYSYYTISASAGLGGTLRIYVGPLSTSGSGSMSKFLGSGTFTI